MSLRGLADADMAKPAPSSSTKCALIENIGRGAHDRTYEKAQYNQSRGLIPAGIRPFLDKNVQGGGRKNDKSNETQFGQQPRLASSN